MWTVEEHLSDLVRHLTRVRESCLLLGQRIIARGEPGDQEFGRNLIARGFVHDAGKFTGIQWEYLHCGPDVPRDKVELAVREHVLTHDHHAEFYGGLEYMPRIAVAEMTCDWLARAQELGTDLREWIREEAKDRYKIKGSQQKWIKEFVGLLLRNPFA